MERPAEDRGALSELRPVHEIHRGRRFIVTRAFGAFGARPVQPVIEKTVEADRPDADTVAALIHEAAVLKRVHASGAQRGVEKVVALRTAGAVPVLVVEDAGSSTLRDRTRRPLEIDTFLELACRLAEILVHVHACDVIHGDINPSNIVLDANGAPTLVDFDRAAIGSSTLSGPRDDLGGALSYASPEQLGRANRVVDRRSDLYSLGTVFYEMLTGAPPFRADDPLEIIHAHLARTPVSPTVVAAGVPRLVSGIVLKLLAKMPSSRYQTAAALLSDLDAARSQWRATAAIDLFELGSVDLALELPLTGRLYGRECELSALRAAVERVSRGPGEVVLIAGEAGVGKSALVQALHEEAAVAPPTLAPETPDPAGAREERKARYISGKVDQRAANVPFASLIEALGGLVADLTEESADQRVMWRQRVLAAVGDNGRVLTELLPELEDLLGPSPELAPLEPLEAQTRLYTTLQAFVQVFASEGRPLAIFLDDLHWADAASLDALRALSTNPEIKHVLFLAAFRPRDVGPDHPITRFEAELKRSRTRVSRIELTPLSRRAVHEFLAEALRAEPARVAPLADLMMRKTAGNPYFLRQLLGSLHRGGLLAFDLEERKWNWKIAQIDAIGITENVVELLLEAIRRLPDETRELLPQVACVGKFAGIGTLVGLTNRSEEETRAMLQPALREGLLVTDAASDGYHFAHDRVQQAAYSLLSEPRRKELHLRIGRLFERRLNAKNDEAVFDAADHINLGAEFLATPAERLDLARLDHRAALKAKASAGFGPALAYARSGLAALPDGAWQTDQALAMLLQREAAECAYLSGDHALCDGLVQVALEHATSVVQKAEIHSLRVNSAASRDAWQEALEHGRRALAELGCTLPSEEDLETAIADESRLVDQLLARGLRGVLLDLPFMSDPADLAVLRLLVALGAPAWWYRDRALFRLLTFRTLRFIIERGHGPESLAAVSQVAMCLSANDRFDAAEAFSAAAQDLAERFGPQMGQRAHAEFVYAAFVERWRLPYPMVLSRLRRARDAAKKSGETRAAAYAMSAMVMYDFDAGRDLDAVLGDLEEGIPFLRKTRNEGILAFHLCYRQSLRCLKGLTARRNEFAEQGFDEEAFLRMAEAAPSLVCLYWIRRLYTSIIFRDFAMAHSYAEAAGQLMTSMAGYVPAVDYLPHASLALLALCETAPIDRRAEWLAKVAENQARLAVWAKSCPANFRHLHVLVEAEIARVEGRPGEASDLYDEAAEAAADGGFCQDAALASELAGRQALARGRSRIADLHLRKARERYAQWGAAEKVRALEEEFPEIGRSDLFGPGTRIREADFDILSLLKSAETIATEVILNRLLERLIHVCAEAAGADRVVVILEEDGAPFVRASGTVDGEVDLERTALSENATIARHTIAQARATRRPMVVDEAVHDPRVAPDPYVTSRAMKSILALPVQRGAELVATLYFENSLVTHAFTGARLRVLELLSAQIAAALENSLLFERLKTEIGDRRRAEGTVRFLANAGAELAESLDSAQIFERLSRVLVPGLADWCSIDVLDEDRQIRRMATTHADPEKASLAREFLVKGVPDWTSPQPPAAVLRTGAPVLIEELTDELLPASCRDAEHMRLVRALGARSVLSVPMLAHGRIVGAITCCISGTTRRYGPDDVTVAQELAHRAALAIDNAGHFQRAQDAVRVREEFLSVAAHELHTPVTSLHLMMQALSRGGVPVTSDNVRQTFGVADRQVRRLIRLIDELLDVSRIDSRRFPLERERVDLVGLVRDVVERFGDDAARTGSSISVQDVDEAVVGSWDRMRLEQVVSNLLSNAIKFGAGKPIAVTVSRTGGQARLDVTDQGIGVPADRLPHIFDRFERGVSSRQYGGLGLGLYIVRSIVESLGGRVGCEAAPGTGSTFCVDLPCEPEINPPGGPIDDLVKNGT
jgi:predicted ATPase/signal transduction histidine kinase